MFRRLAESAGAIVRLVVDGRPVEARAGDSVAAALLAVGRTRFAHPPRAEGAHGPYCMMGACGDCLVRIRDLGETKACMVHVRDGMEIVTLDAPPARAP